MAQGCRLMQRSEVGGYPEYTDRDDNLLDATAPDPLLTFSATLSMFPMAKYAVPQ
jgi:hypothetical protein